MTRDTKVIGSTVIISIPVGGLYDLPAKVDTGADGSSIWATKIKVKDGVLEFCLLGPSSDNYSGQVVKTKDFKIVRVHNSFGHSEIRYKVTLSVLLEGHKVRARFTLANRNVKSYPALIGRRLLNRRFIVDVSKADKL